LCIPGKSNHGPAEDRCEGAARVQLPPPPSGKKTGGGYLADAPLLKLRPILQVLQHVIRSSSRNLPTMTASLPSLTSKLYGFEHGRSNYEIERMADWQ
jgi:hypothetical protein